MRRLPLDVATGNQIPTELVLPDATSNDVLDTLDLLAEAGREAMDWQAVLLQCWMGVLPNGRWAASTCGNQTPRQNGKTFDLQARAANEMLFYNGTVIYTSQLQKTSTETFEETAALFDTKALRKFLAPHGIRTALGREEIRLKSGARMKFLARTAKAGNGQHGSLLIFDEAQYLDPSAQASFLPAISACRTKRGPQTIYNGNAPDEGDAALVFTKIRNDALSGKTKRTAWTSWGVPSSPMPPDTSDRAMWERTNPAWGVLINEDVIDAEHEAMDEAKFAHQRLGWFRESVIRSDAIIDAATWAALEVDEAPEAWERLAFGVRFSPDGMSVALSAAVTHGMGAHVEFIREEPTVVGVAWLVEWLAPRMGKACAVCIDGKAWATDLAIQLASARVPRNALIVATPSDATSAAGMFVSAINDRSLTHLQDAALAESVLSATRRPIGKTGGFGFDGEFTQRIDACALALYAARTSKRNPKSKATVW